MGKFRLRLKLQGLEVEIDGEREDLPAITAAVQKQFSGMVDPIEIAAADGRKQLSEGNGPVLDAEAIKDKVRTPRKRSGSRSSAETAGQVIDFRHDSAKYGNPLQDWTLIEKCVWLLEVIEGITSTKEVSGPQLAVTFNNYYKASGKIHPPHVTRDLGKAKVQNPALVGEDKTLWFLTVAGKAEAQRLIDSVVNPSVA